MRSPIFSALIFDFSTIKNKLNQRFSFHALWNFPLRKKINENQTDSIILRTFFPQDTTFWVLLHKIEQIGQKLRLHVGISAIESSMSGREFLFWQLDYENKKQATKTPKSKSLKFMLILVSECLFRVSTKFEISSKEKSQQKNQSTRENISRHICPWTEEIFCPLCLMLMWLSNSFPRIFINY